MAESENADVLIQDTERIAVDNRPNPNTNNSQLVTEPMLDSNKSTIMKKKRHAKKPGASKGKRLKERLDQDTTTPSNTDQKASTQVPPEHVFIPPEVLTALKHSLKDDIVQICQQTMKGTVNHPDPPPSLLPHLHLHPLLKRLKLNRIIKMVGVLGRLKLLGNSSSSQNPWTTRAIRTTTRMGMMMMI